MQFYIRHRGNRARLASATAIMVIFAAVAQAQDSATPAGVPPASAGNAAVPQTALENITVTARRREEKLQSVPLQIRALTAKDLSAAGVQDLRDITFLTPGLTFKSTGAQANETPTIRGQSDLGTGTISDNNVPVFFDGVFIANASAIDFGLVRLARVEVIEGPVSALYGRSAYAGAINYVSAKPTDTYSGGLEYTVGNYGKENVRADVSGPIYGDILTGGVSGSYDSFDGTYHDNVTGQNAGGDDRKDILGNLDFKPTPDIEIRPVIYYGSDFFADAPTEIAAANCGPQPLTTGFNYTRSYCGQVPNASFMGPYIAKPGDLGTTGNNRSVLSTNLQAKYDTEFGTFTSLTGYNNIRTTQYTEFDNLRYGIPVQTYYLPPGAQVGSYGPGGSPVFFSPNTAQILNLPLHFGYSDRERDFSQELRFTSLQDQRLRYSIGGYYAKTVRSQDLVLGLSTEGVPAGQFIISPFATAPGVKESGQQTLSELQSRIAAVFGSADFDITKNLTLSSELRWTSDRQVFEQPYAVYDPYYPGYSTGAASVLDPDGPAAHRTFYSVTSRNTISFKPAPGLLFYGSAANGEKAGGFNDYSFTSAKLQGLGYAPETNWTYEAGLKTTLFDSRLQFNADYFHIDSQNYQVSGPANSAQAGNFVIRNFGGLTTNGVEASVAANPVAGVTIFTGVSYSDPTFNSKSFDFADVALCGAVPSCAGRVVQDGANKAVKLSGLRPPDESNLTFNTSISLDYPVYEDYHWFGRVDYRYEGQKYYLYPVDTGKYGPLNNVNLRTGISKGMASLTLWVDNATDDKTPVSVTDSASTGSLYSFFESGYYPVAILPEGRTFGATFRYRFSGAKPAMPPVEPPSTMAGPVPTVTPARTYLVFFDWDRSDLTARARQIVESAAAASTHVQTTRIEVDGYTDLSGTAPYNQKLSVRRAEAVEKELVHDGVSAEEISIHGYGESNPLVPTAKGVREPQNRRVEIVLK